jgi:hypothetical protein
VILLQQLLYSKITESDDFATALAGGVIRKLPKVMLLQQP